MEQIVTIVDEAQTEISCAASSYTLEQLRSKYLGKNSAFNAVFKSMATMDPTLRPKVGQEVNQAKEQILKALNERSRFLEQELLQRDLISQGLDVTLPGRGKKVGHLHPVTQVRYDFEDFFNTMGFSVIEGPEIEDDFHNFTALNIPESHPARAQHDTFYFANGSLLRTHTSPVQIRAMQSLGAPLRIITPGRVYRRDSDATHTPMFHQMEGLVIDEGISFANLKWMLQSFLEYFFAEQVTIRLRPSYFPFTEPSAEVDVKRVIDGEERWLEVFGCGMVHPRVLEFGGIDSKRYSGFAFGLGLDRFAMLRYGVNDLRTFFSNDVNFIEQF